MKHANRRVRLSSTIKGTYANVRLPRNCAWAMSPPACGHRMPLLWWMAVEGNCALADHQNTRLGWEADFRFDERWDSRFNPKSQGEPICQTFSSVWFKNGSRWFRVEAWPLGPRNRHLKNQGLSGTLLALPRAETWHVLLPGCGPVRCRMTTRGRNNLPHPLSRKDLAQFQIGTESAFPEGREQSTLRRLFLGWRNKERKGVAAFSYIHSIYVGVAR